MAEDLEAQEGTPETAPTPSKKTKKKKKTKTKGTSSQPTTATTSNGSKFTNIDIEKPICLFIGAFERKGLPRLLKEWRSKERDFVSWGYGEHGGAGGRRLPRTWL